MRAITVSRYRTQYPYVASMLDHGSTWRMYADTSKNEDTWCEALCDYDREYDTAQRIILWAMARMALHTNRNSNGNLYVRYLYWNDDRWNWNNNWLDNDWNDNNPTALRATLFNSHPASAGLSLPELSIPSAEHSAYLVYSFRNCNIFRVIQRFCLP